MYKKYCASLAVTGMLFGVMGCSKFICDQDPMSTDCNPLNPKLEQGVEPLLLLKQSVKIRFFVTSTNLDLGPVSFSLSQQGKNLPLAVDVTGPYHYEAMIHGGDLNGFVPGLVSLTAQQLGRNPGSPVNLTLDHTDFNFELIQADVKLPPINSSDVVPGFSEMVTVGILKKQIAVSRHYHNAAKQFVTEYLLQDYNGISGAVPKSIASVDGVNDYNIDFSLTGVWTTQLVKASNSYNLSKCNEGDLPCLPKLVEFILDTSDMVNTRMTLFRVSADDKRLFATGTKGTSSSIYTLLADASMPKSFELIPFTATSSDLRILPISSTSLLVSSKSPISNKLWSLSNSAWVGLEVVSLAGVSLDAMAVGTMSMQNMPVLAIASGDQITFYKIEGDGSFTLANGVITLPSSSEPVRSMALGDLNGDDISDLAILTQTKLYVALHR